MEPDSQDLFESRVEATGPQFNLIQHSLIVPKKVNNQRRRPQTIAFYFLTLITSITTLYTLIGVTWLLFRLQLLSDESRLIETITSGDEIKQINLNQDLVADNLLIGGGGIKFKQIIADQVGLSSGYSDNGRHQAEVYTDTDSTLMQATSYGSSEHGRYSFLLSKQLNNLEITKGITNLKLIRSPNRQQTTILPASTYQHQQSNLEILGKDKLELSGNLGLKVYSNHIDLNSNRSINLSSKEDSILLVSLEGFLLPNIISESMNKNSPFAQDAKSYINYESRSSFDNNYYQNSLDESINSYNIGIPNNNYNKHHLCINSGNGRIYKQITSGFC